MDASDASSITLLNPEINPVKVVGEYEKRYNNPQMDLEHQKLLVLIISGLVQLPHVIFWLVKALGTIIAEGSRVVLPLSDLDTSIDESCKNCK
jgi:hypothetical protein